MLTHECQHLSQQISPLSQRSRPRAFCEHDAGIGIAVHNLKRWTMAAYRPYRSHLGHIPGTYFALAGGVRSGDSAPRSQAQRPQGASRYSEDGRARSVDGSLERKASCLKGSGSKGPLSAAFLALFV